MKQQHDYIETSIWYRDHISDPYQRIAECFTAMGVQSYRKTIKDILSSAISMKVYEKSSPGNLLYEVGLLESLINAAFLINQENKKSPIDIPDYGIFNPNYFRGQYSETDWEYFPRALSLKEYRNPYVVFKRFFKFMNLPDWKRDLKELLETALTKSNLIEGSVGIDCLSVYLHLTKLVEAAHLIDVREITHIGGILKNKIKGETL